MVCKRCCALCGITQIHAHYDCLILVKLKSCVKSIRIKSIEPAAVYAFICCRKDHVCCNDSSVLSGGSVLAAGICKAVCSAVGHNQNRGGSVATGCSSVDLRQIFFLLENIDVLSLEIFCGRCKTSGIEDSL